MKVFKLLSKVLNFLPKEIFIMIIDFEPCLYLDTNVDVPRRFRNGLLFNRGTLYLLGKNDALNVITRKIGSFDLRILGAYVGHSGWVGWSASQLIQRPATLDWQGCYMPSNPEQEQTFEKDRTLYRISNEFSQTSKQKLSSLLVSCNGTNWKQYFLQIHMATKNEQFNSWCIYDHYLVCVLREIVGRQWTLYLFDLNDTQFGSLLSVVTELKLPCTSSAHYAYVLADSLFVHILLDVNYFRVSLIETQLKRYIANVPKNITLIK